MQTYDGAFVTSSKMNGAQVSKNKEKGARNYIYAMSRVQTQPRDLTFSKIIPEWKVFLKTLEGLSVFFSKFVKRSHLLDRASASQSVDLGFISLVESFQKTLKNGIHSFPAWRSAHKG